MTHSTSSSDRNSSPAATRDRDADAEEAERALDAVQMGLLLCPLANSWLVIEGKDRKAWLNGLITCDLAPLEAGDGAYGLMVAKNGKIKSEVYVLVEKDGISLSLPRELTQSLMTDLDHHLVMEDAEMTLDAERQSSLILGARAHELTPGDLPAGSSTSALFTRRGVPMRLLSLAAGDAFDDVAASLDGRFGPAAVATEAGLHRVRVEHGLPAFGVDFDTSHYPQEASLEADGVSFRKGCYLGQEAVFMLQNRGHVKKRLVQLWLEGPVAHGDIICSEAGDPIGEVTSAALRPNRNLALGMVKYKWCHEDATVLIRGAKASVTALLALPKD